MLVMEIVDHYGEIITTIDTPIPFFVRIETDQNSSYKYYIVLTDNKDQVRGYYYGTIEGKIIQLEIPPTVINFPGTLTITATVSYDDGTKESIAKTIIYKKKEQSVNLPDGRIHLKSQPKVLMEINTLKKQEETLSEDEMKSLFLAKDDLSSNNNP